MTHWRTQRCEGRKHSASLFYCTYPNCDCYFRPDGDLRDDNDLVPVHGDVLGDRPRPGIQGDAGDNVVPMSRGRRASDGEPAIHRPSETGDLRLRASQDEALDTDRHSRIIEHEFEPWKIAVAVFLIGFWVSIVYMVLKATGAK